MSDGKGSQTYEYDDTTGALKELVDSIAGTFTVLRHRRKSSISESYPNAISANYTLNADRRTNEHTIRQGDHCTEKCPKRGSATKSFHQSTGSG